MKKSILNKLLEKDFKILPTFANIRYPIPWRKSVPGQFDQTFRIAPFRFWANTTLIITQTVLPISCADDPPHRINALWACSSSAAFRRIFGACDKQT